MVSPHPAVQPLGLLNGMGDRPDLFADELGGDEHRCRTSDHRSHGQAEQLAQVDPHGHLLL
jgi:hypothetical protein